MTTTMRLWEIIGVNMKGNHVTIRIRAEDWDHAEIAAHKRGIRWDKISLIA